jgi:hypothetical protein
MPDPERDKAIVTSLLEVLGLVHDNLLHLDETKKYGPVEIGADVEVRLVELGTVGVQVTEFCADEGIADPQRGLRATEKRNAAQGKFPTYGLGPMKHQLEALRLRVTAKIKTLDRAFREFNGVWPFDETWLLVAASVPDASSLVSTSALPAALDVEGLNRVLDERLRRSRYTRVFLHLQISGIVYEWSASTAWHCVRDSQTHVAVSFAEMQSYLRDPDLNRRTPPHPMVIEKSCGECGGPFTRDLPRREPARSDGRYIHADQEYCERLRRVTAWRMP